MKCVLKNVMKTGILLALVLLGTACTQNDELLQQPQGGRTYVVAMEQPATSRATLTVNAGKATFQFEAGDKIWITANKTADNAYEAVEVTLAETEGSLGFTLPTGYDTPVQAVFGATIKTVDDNGAINQVTLSSYNYTSEYPSDAHAVLYAEFPTDNSNTLEFQYLTGILSVTLDYVPVDVDQVKITSQGSSSPMLKGHFNIVDTDEGKKQIESAGGLSSNDIDFNILDATTVRSGMTFYVPLPVGTYEGFEVKLYDRSVSFSNPTLCFSKATNTGKTYTIDRATLNTLPTVEVLMHVSTPGSLDANRLSEHISPNGTLTIIGSIDNTDLNTLKTWLQGATVPETLKTLDLSGTTGLTEIPAWFFEYYEGYDDYKGLPATLTGIYLPTSVTTIGNYAFYGCTSLNTISMPAVTTIGEMAFYKCTSLNTVSMPSATTIGESAFYGCTSLNTVSIPVAETIGNSAFQTCTSLNTVSIPVAETIGNSAFSYCTSLKTVSMPAAKTIDFYAFYGCTSLKTVLMSVVTEIGGYVFQSCTALKEITLGSGGESHTFTSVDPKVFYGYTPPTDAVLKLYGAGNPVTVDADNNTRTWKPVDTDINISGVSEVWLNDKQVYPAP